MKSISEMYEIQGLFDDFKRKHKKADRYTFLALLEVFCRNGFDLGGMKQAIRIEIGTANKSLNTDQKQRGENSVVY